MPDVKLDGDGSKPMKPMGGSLSVKKPGMSSAPRPPKPGTGHAPTATRVKQVKPQMAEPPGIKKGAGPTITGVATTIHGFLSHDSAENKEGGVCHCASGYDHGMGSCRSHGVGPVMTSGMEGGSHGSSGKKC